MNDYKSFYKTVKGAEGNRCYYPTRLDLYGKGCYFNCTYCYAKQVLNFRKLWQPTHPGIAPILDVYRTIDKIQPGSVIRLGGMTDCFQPIEKEMKNTYHAINRLNRNRIHYLIVTKSDLIINPEYMEILDPELAHIQISIPTTDNKVLAETDNAPPFENRVKAVETLQENGYDITLRLSPFLYETSDFKRINKINTDKCLVEFLRIKPSMINALKDFITPKEYYVKGGGYRHLSIDKKLEILKKLHFKQLTVCDDVKNHYEYFKHNINHNPNDCCNLRL